MVRSDKGHCAADDRSGVPTDVAIDTLILSTRAATAASIACAIWFVPACSSLCCSLIGMIVTPGAMPLK